MAHMREPVPRPSSFVPGLPQGIEHIILRAMAKDPAARYGRANEMAADLAYVANELRGHVYRSRVPTRQLDAGTAEIPAAHLPQVLAPRGSPGAPGTCFRCGAANDPRHRFCTTCGYELSGSRARADTYLLDDGRPLRCQLVARSGKAAGQAFTLHQDTTAIGRTQGNDVVLPDPTVSRHHARLTFRRGQWYLEDLNSSNGTYVNNIRINRPAPLMEGDELRFGDEVLDFALLA
jgi:hypothetical protein